MPTLCDACRQRHASLVLRCAHCALPLGKPQLATKSAHTCDQSHAWQQAAARINYEPPMDQWIKRLKFAGDWTVAEVMGHLMKDCRMAETLRKRADWILPLPLSPSRLRARGYNQSAWFAKQWCGRDARLKPDWLVKVRETAPQAQTDRATRLTHLEGSMTVDPSHHPALQGARVLLVDDVMTTGATLDVATRCVLAAGALSVDVAVFARTPANAPHP